MIEHGVYRGGHIWLCFYSTLWKAVETKSREPERHQVDLSQSVLIDR